MNTQFLMKNNKQRGATLFTSLVFLALMTIVGVSAAKVSMLDVLVSGNNQRQMEVFQDTSNDLKQLTDVRKLYKPIIGKIEGSTTHTFDPVTGIYEVPGTASNSTQEITDPGKRYDCQGFRGEAVSIGPDTPPCDLYDFRVKYKKNGSSANDVHNRGAGKEKPNGNKNSYL